MPLGNADSPWLNTEIVPGRVMFVDIIQMKTKWVHKT